MTRNGTTGDLWYWPGGLYMLIPIFFVWALYLMVLLEHICNLAMVHDAALRFQAVFVRIILVFPLTALLFFFGAAFPWSSIWITFVCAILETYCLATLFAMMVGFAHLEFNQEMFQKEMMKSWWTNRPFIGCGSTFKDADQAFFVFKCCVFQALIFKPVSLLCIAIIFSVVQHVPIAASVILKFIGALSLIVSVAFILRFYKWLADAPGSPFKEHHIFWKFVVVKLLFLLIILNSILLSPLISAKIIPVPAIFCSPDAYDQEHGEDYCQQRLGSIIFIFEICILIIPACFAYRHHGLRKVDVEGSRNIAHFLYCAYINVFDLGQFMRGEVVNNKDQPSAEEVHKLLDEIAME